MRDSKFYSKHKSLLGHDNPAVTIVIRNRIRRLASLYIVFPPRFFPDVPTLSSVCNSCELLFTRTNKRTTMLEDENKSSEDRNPNESATQPQNTETSAVKERSEYFEKLEKWLQEAYVCQSVAAMFPYYVMSTQMLNPTTGVNPFQQVPSNAGFATASNVQANADVNSPETNEGLRLRRPQDTAGIPRPPGAEGFEYRIPPLWKRFFAEFIDFMVLFFLKLSITFIAVDFFDFIDIERYDLDMIQKNLRIDYEMALEMTSGILILELIHRIIVCIFEALWLQHGINGCIGGATPGKIVMGLRVVQCRNVTPIERPDGSDLVFITPGTDLGFPLSLGRSIVKNLILAFLFPISFALFFFRFNRTGYDLVCNSIVIECPYRDRANNRARQQQQ
ncbi:protein FAM8A1 isoform X1 [Neodiprion virginianus]|uniref:protein FAM8A1 isoform X1 n=1 Tax=Neodiprion virginianus TaxID=2961670 RepID=UPI001EE6E97D|nr:protein FAM8A1 isoform X1 [Neodiprion virginianus]